MNDSIKNLRVVAILEGISFLVLLLIAMPIKYYMHIPEVVKYVGWAHGVLFITYIPLVFLAKKAMQWNWFHVLVALAASLVPFGTFVLDRQLKHKLTARNNF